MSQSSWIQNKSVRENILCGKEFSASRYQTVVCASALIPDLLAMPFGDNTEIGENGVNLSGGQKARISLARMGYRSEDYDLVLLDDPFAALDAHVGNLIFEQFILSGFLKDKTRIIALNSHMHLLKDFDRIIVLGVSSDSEEGAESTILADGSYDQIYREFFELFHADANTEGVNSGQQKFASPSSNESVLNSEDTIVLDEIQGKLHQLSNDEAANLIQKEDRYEGKVKKSSYLSYFKAASSFSWRYVGVIVVFISFAFGQVLRTLSDIWAVSWSARTIYPEKGNSFWIGTFSCFLIFTIILSLFRSLYFIHLTTTASQTLHENLLKNLVTAPVPTFFGKLMSKILFFEFINNLFFRCDPGWQDSQ